MDMFGGLTKTSSRIAIAAALGLTLGGYAMSFSPAQAADFGGDCCADLEERVAELEATTVRKGNKKVSVTLSGWVIKTMNWWDDGGSGSFFVGDKDYDLGSRFALTGSATIAPGWSAGYNLTVLAPSDVFGFGSNQINEDSGGPLSISTLYSYIYVKSDKWGTLNWGSLSPASDNPAVLADISGTVIESNAVWFEGNGFFLRPSGGGGLSALTWGSFIGCLGLGAGIGTDCWGAAQPAVRYDSPTFGGFRIETSYGTNSLTGPGPSPDSNFWDIAAFYNGDWGNFKVSAAYAFTWVETAVLTGSDADLNQVGATVMHAPSGIGLYGLYQHETSGAFPETDAWYLKPFIKRTWNPLGATVLYGEYGHYSSQYGSQFGVDQCAAGNFAAPAVAGANAAIFCATAGNALFVSDSDVERWGLGVVQEIDSAAMHLFARWQHQDIDVDFTGLAVGVGPINVNQGFEDWNMIQLGGIIFF
jgi:hypothetical protein